MGTYCKFLAKGKCRKGAACKFSHREEDSPEYQRKAHEQELQLSLVCILCNLPVVASGLWFGLTTGCSHVFCYECLEEKEEKNCPQCEKVFGDCAPSGLFHSKPKLRLRAIRYFNEHQESLLQAYENRHCRDDKCGFQPCPTKITLEDGTIRCAHGEFNEESHNKKLEEKKSGWKEENERQRIRKNARMVKEWVKTYFKLQTVVIILITVFLMYCFIIWIQTETPAPKIEVKVEVQPPVVVQPMCIPLKTNQCYTDMELVSDDNELENGNSNYNYYYSY